MAKSDLPAPAEPQISVGQRDRAHPVEMRGLAHQRRDLGVERARHRVGEDRAEVVAQRRLSACVDLFALQSVFLALTAALVAFLTDIHHIYIAAALTIIIKVVVIPRILKQVIERLNVTRPNR